MQPIWCNLAAFAVALLFFIWRTHRRVRQRRCHTLRQRVAYLLWVVSQCADGSAPSPPAPSLRLGRSRLTPRQS
jgi:hypothetical protein